MLLFFLQSVFTTDHWNWPISFAWRITGPTTLQVEGQRGGQLSHLRHRQVQQIYLATVTNKAVSQVRGKIRFDSVLLLASFICFTPQSPITSDILRTECSSHRLWSWCVNATNGEFTSLLFLHHLHRIHPSSQLQHNCASTIPPNTFQRRYMFTSRSK